MEPSEHVLGTKQQERDLRIARANQVKLMRRLGWLLVALVVLTGVAWLIIRAGKARQNLPGESFANVGNEHIAFSDPLPKPYNSNPPSSGAHFKGPANWDIYDYEVNDRLFIHNLEHGGIWISYKPAVPSQVVADLRAIVNELGGSKIVMAPRSANDADIAIVAWTHVFKFDVTGDGLTDAEKSDIKRFYDGFKNRGPEFVPDSMAGVDPKTAQP